MNLSNHFLFLAAFPLVLAAPSASPGEKHRIYYDTLENGRLTGGKVVVDSEDPEFRNAFGLNAQSNVGGGWSSTTVLDNGPVTNRVDIVMLGDGYTHAQMPNYATHVNSVIFGFFAQEPFLAYKPYFNVHRVDVISNQSGVDEIDLGIYRDTALNMAYGCFNIDRLICIDIGLAQSAAQSAPDVQQILALANSTRYGGAGYSDYNIGTMAGNNSASIEIALHEFGHAFADLADEYDYADGEVYNGPEPIEANISIYNASAQINQQRKWWRWMNLANVDTFEGAAYNEFGIYRPTNNSKMRALSRPFEQVNVEQLVLNIYKIVKPIDNATESTVTPVLACNEFFVDPMQPSDHALSVQWSIDGIPVSGATGLTFTPSSTLPSLGLHTLSVQVMDNTTRVRDESLRAQWMSETRSWTIVVPAPYGDLSQDGLVGFEDIFCALEGFSNPSNCPAADLAPCTPDGRINLEDILAVIGAYLGFEPCSTCE